MADQPASIDSILSAALEITQLDQRATYLDEACGGDVDLRAQVDKLLRAHFLAGSFLECPIVGDRPTEVLDALTDTEELPGAISPLADEISLDFLEPSNVPGRLGKLGPYEVIDVIGRGGMGVVLRAYDPKLSRMVAIKVLTPEFAANPTARKRFQREARAAAAVSHPHVVTIHAVEEDDNTPYMVMECVIGQSLREKIEREGALKLEEILRIGSQIAAGLAAAHHQGLIHRDIKPSNILLENSVERVKITDFGLARAVDDIGMTRTGEVSGTPEFMSPEQAQGLAVEHRSDLFSLGSVLYAMCTGRSPFRADTTVAVLRRVCDNMPRPIREVHSEIPEELVAIIDRLLAKDPDERFQTADEVGELLGQHLAYLQHPTKTPPSGLPGDTSDMSGQAGPIGKFPRPLHGSLRRRRWSVAGLVLLVVLASLSITEATGVTRVTAILIRIVTGEGTLVVTVDDPAVSVTIEGQDMIITGAGPKEVQLKSGKYRLYGSKNGKQVPIDQELVTITRGGREVVHVTLVPPAADAPRKIDEVPWSTILPADAPAPAVAPFDATTARRHQQAWADYLGKPVEREIELPGGEKLTLVLIPPGDFLMGSSQEEQARFLKEAEADNDSWSIKRTVTEASHQVRITKPFAISRHEITRGQFRAFVDQTGYRTVAEQSGKGGRGFIGGTWTDDPIFTWSADPGFPQTDDHPVVNVAWDDAMAFCQWLSKKEGEEYHLPTEVQWEYACRAGTTTPWYCGGSHATLEEYAWFKANADDKTHSVGQLKPNCWGLFDMHGNVWEWCADRYAADYYGQSPLNDPRGPAAGLCRVARGGCWMLPARICRSAYRDDNIQQSRNCDLGFRVTVVFVDKSLTEMP